MKLTLTRTYARRSDPSVATLTVEVAAADRAELEAMLAASTSKRVTLVVAREPAQETCGNGHVRTEANTYLRHRDGAVLRECRACMRASVARSRARKVAKQKAAAS